MDAMIPDRLPESVQNVDHQWNLWHHGDTKNIPLAWRRVMDGVPDVLSFLKELHMEAQRVEAERDFWRGETGRYFTLLLRQQRGEFSIRIPFTDYRIALIKDQSSSPPLLPQEGDEPEVQ
jgi:hypothetical protein